MQELDGKPLSLKFTLKKTTELMKSNNIEAISRHKDAIMSKIKAIHTLKESIIEHKSRELCVQHSDTGARSSYASAVLLDKIPKRMHTQKFD